MNENKKCCVTGWSSCIAAAHVLHEIHQKLPNSHHIRNGSRTQPNTATGKQLAAAESRPQTSLIVAEVKDVGPCESFLTSFFFFLLKKKSILQHRRWKLVLHFGHLRIPWNRKVAYIAFFGFPQHIPVVLASRNTEHLYMNKCKHCKPKRKCKSQQNLWLYLQG